MISPIKSQHKLTDTDLYVLRAQKLTQKYIAFIKCVATKGPNGERSRITQEELMLATGASASTVGRMGERLDKLGFIRKEVRRISYAPGVQKTVCFYSLRKEIFTDKAKAFYQRVLEHGQTLSEKIDVLYISLKGNYYKLKDYLGRSKFYFFELAYNFRKDQREKLNKFLQEVERWLDKPGQFISKKEERVMETLGYIQHPKTPESYMEPECVYSPRSSQPFGFNTAQMWEKAHRRDRDYEESITLERISQIDKQLSEAPEANTKKDIEQQMYVIERGMFNITNKLLFGFAQEKIQAKQQQQDALAQLKALGEQLNAIKSQQANLIQERDQLEARLVKLRRVKDFSVALSV